MRMEEQTDLKKLTVAFRILQKRLKGITSVHSTNQQAFLSQTGCVFVTYEARQTYVIHMHATLQISDNYGVIM